MQDFRFVPDSSLAAMSFAKPACSQCIVNRGLCASCAELDRSILPQLKLPSWPKLIVKRQAIAAASVAVAVTELPELGVPGRRAARRLMRALGGSYTRSA